MSRRDTLSDRYLPRFLAYGIRNSFRQTVDDYRLFSTTEVSPSEAPFHFKKDLQAGLLPDVTYRSKSGQVTEPLDQLLVMSGTTAFLVIRDGTVIDERYLSGGGEKAPSRLMSATKSFLSALVGIAVDRGMIESIDLPVSRYIPELKANGFDRMTLRNLLNMESGILFDQGQMPWSIQMRQYLTPNARKDLLRLRVSDPVNETFHYNDWYPNLLAYILEAASGKTVAEFFETMLWKPIGAENHALLVEDSKTHQFAKMDSGLVATACDLAKFGRLYMNNGMLDGQRILSEEWIQSSIAPPAQNPPYEYYRRYHGSPWGNWLKTEHAYYNRMWWGYRISQSENDYFAMGVLGQFLYVCPRNRLILVRLGKDWGVHAWWPSILKSLADQIGK